MSTRYSRPKDGWRAVSQMDEYKCVHCGEMNKWTFSYAIKLPSWHELLVNDLREFWNSKVEKVKVWWLLHG